MKRISILFLMLLFGNYAYADCASDLVQGAKISPTSAQVFCATLASSSASASIIPDTDNTYDLGSASLSWRTLYTGTSRIAKTSDILRVRQDPQRLFTWDASSDTALTETFGDGGVTALQQKTVSGSTADADDDSTLFLTGGGAIASDGSRGGYIQLPGEEVAGGADITYNAGIADTHIFQVAGATSWTIGSTLTQDGTNGSDLVGNTAPFLIRQGTSDGADSKSIIIAGGGAFNQNGTRGAGINMEGNETAGFGDMYIFAGDATAASINIDINQSAGLVNVRNISDVPVITMNNSGQITSAATSDIGWSVVAAPNQACNTTCTSACVTGIDTLGTGGFLGCAVATADFCLCAGAS